MRQYEEDELVQVAPNKEGQWLIPAGHFEHGRRRGNGRRAAAQRGKGGVMRLLRERRSKMSRIMKWADCFDEELRKDEEP